MTTTRYRCSSDRFARCSAGTGTPRSKSCTYCKSTLVVLYGTWGAFEWVESGRYPEAAAQRTFKSEKIADRWADVRGLVVRWIPA